MMYQYCSYVPGQVLINEIGKALLTEYSQVDFWNIKLIFGHLYIGIILYKYV